MIFFSREINVCYHKGNLHPESIKSLKKIKDGSISDLIFPWNPPIQINIKQEIQTTNTFDGFTSDNSNDGSFSHESENISDNNEENDTNNEIKVDILNQFKQELITNEDFDPEDDQNSKIKEFKCQV